MGLTQNHRLTLVVISCFAFGIAGCERDRGFRTHAVYRGPVNKLEVMIDADGVVLAGHDVSDDATGYVRVTSLDDSAPASFQLKVDGGAAMATYTKESGETGSVSWTWKTADDSMQQLLSDAGIEVASVDELQECVHVINAALAGPKGTTLKGQAKLLEVVEVNAKYK